MSDINDSNIRNFVEQYITSPSSLPPISAWNVSQVTNMSDLFKGFTYFNEDLSAWDVSQVTNMKGMFHECEEFNQNLSAWDVSQVTNMSMMFQECTHFDQPLNWGEKVHNVTDMSEMFLECSFFNQDLSAWDVSQVKNMGKMFNLCKRFNQELNWGEKVHNVTNMSEMFKGCLIFDQDLSAWDVSQVTNMERMFDDCPIRAVYKPKFTLAEILFVPETLEEKKKKIREIISSIQPNNKTALFFACEAGLFTEALFLSKLMLDPDDPTKPNKISIQDSFGNTALEIVSDNKDTTNPNKNELLKLLKKEFEKTYLTNEECIICDEKLDGIHGPTNPETPPPEDEIDDIDNPNDVISVCINSHIFHRQCIVKSCKPKQVDVVGQMGLDLGYQDNVDLVMNTLCPLCKEPLIPICEGLRRKKRLPMNLLKLPSPSSSSTKRKSIWTKKSGKKKRTTLKWRKRITLRKKVKSLHV